MTYLLEVVKKADLIPGRSIELLRDALNLPEQQKLLFLTSRA